MPWGGEQWGWVGLHEVAGMGWSVVCQVQQRQPEPWAVQKACHPPANIIPLLELQLEVTSGWEVKPLG